MAYGCRSRSEKSRTPACQPVSPARLDVFADVVAFPNLPFKLFAASSDLVEIVIRNMTPFLPDLALRLPIPCSILSGNVLQSLGEHIATLNVDGAHRVPTWFRERASLGRHPSRRLAVSR